MKMNKAEFAAFVAKKYGMNKGDTLDWVTAIFDSLSEVITIGNDVNIQGFGRFKFKNRAPKRFVNPANGKDEIMPAHNTITFSASKLVKEAAKNAPISPTSEEDDNDDEE